MHILVNGGQPTVAQRLAGLSPEELLPDGLDG